MNANATGKTTSMITLLSSLSEPSSATALLAAKKVIKMAQIIRKTPYRIFFNKHRL